MPRKIGNVRVDVGALAGGQQRVEDRGGDRHIAGGERHLQQCHAQPGQVDLVAEQPQPGDDARQRHIGRDDAPQRDADRAQHGDRQVVAEERHRPRLQQQGAPPSTRPPNMNVTLQNAAVRAICPGVMPQCAYSR